MAVLPIVTYNDPVLRVKTKDIEKDSEEIQQLIENMFETMYNSKGVGLAAPQVGSEMRLFVLNADPVIKEEEGEDHVFGPEVFINPEIVWKSDDKIEIEEGCLSIPDIRENVTRPKEITVTYLNRDFEEKTLKADGWLARVIQHEKDHLDGVLFIDYLGSFRRRLLKGKLNEIENGSKKVEYPVVPKAV